MNSSVAGHNLESGKKAAVFEWGLLALLAFGVCAFGAVQAWAYGIIEIGVFALFMAALWTEIRRNLGLLRPAFGPFLFVFFCALAVVPVPAHWLERLSPAKFEVLSGIPAELVPAGRLGTALSISSYSTQVMLIKVVMYVGMFFLAYLFFDYRGKKPAFLSGLIVLGVFEGAYGLVQYLTGWQKIFFFTKQFYTEEATGTYINRNHYAGFLEMLVPLMLALMLANLNSFSRGRRQTSPGRVMFLPSPLLGVCAGVMLLGLLYSRSRMGIAAGLVSLLFVGALAARSTQSWRGLALTLVLLLIAGTYGAWVGYQPVKERFGELAEEKGGDLGLRLHQWQDTFNMIRDYPLVGTGLGTYSIAYPRYQTLMSNSRIDHAHNDYLQFVAETGLVGACLLFLPIFYVWWVTVRTGLRTTSVRRRYLALGVSGSILALLLHSTVDFNLQIPANAMLFSMLLGVGYKICVIEQEESDAAHGVVFEPAGESLALQGVRESRGISTY